jgi:MFS transporter, ACDE family, multidrug resistance protein
MTSMAGGAIAPVLPDMIHDLQLNPLLAANLVSLHCLTTALFSPILGILADRIGRVRVLVVSLVLYAIVGIATAYSSDITVLLLLRGLLGATSGGIAAASLGLLISLYEGDARVRALGVITSTLATTSILYPLFGGWIGRGHWQSAFYLYLLGLPLAGLALWILPSPAVKPTTPTLEVDAKLRQVLLQPQVLGVLFSLVLAAIAMYSVVAYAPMYYRQAIQADSALNGGILASRAVGAALVSAVGTRWLLLRVGWRGAIAIGFICMGSTLLTIPIFQALPLIMAAGIVFGFGIGIVQPVLYGRLAEFAPAHLRSSVLAAGTGAGFLGQFLCPVLLAPALNQLGLANVFYVAAGVAGFGGAIVLRQKKSAPVG